MRAQLGETQLEVASGYVRRLASSRKDDNVYTSDAGQRGTMSNAELLREENFTLHLMYGQFYINGGADGTSDWDSLVQQAIGAGRFAGDEANIVVISPVSYNPALPVQVEVWTTEPEQDPDCWEVSIRHALSVDHRSQVHLITAEGTTPGSFSLSPGPYQFEILGHTRSSVTGLNQSAPEDRWKLRVWPAQT